MLNKLLFVPRLEFIIPVNFINSSLLLLLKFSCLLSFFSLACVLLFLLILSLYISINLRIIFLLLLLLLLLSLLISLLLLLIMLFLFLLILILLELVYLLTDLFRISLSTNLLIKFSLLLRSQTKIILSIINLLLSIFLFLLIFTMLISRLNNLVYIFWLSNIVDFTLMIFLELLNLLIIQAIFLKNLVNKIISFILKFFRLRSSSIRYKAVVLGKSNNRIRIPTL